MPGPAPSAGASTSSRASPAGASSATSTTQADIAIRDPAEDDLVAMLTRRAGDDPAWWGVIRAYCDGHALFPDPFKPKRPPFPV